MRLVVQRTCESTTVRIFSNGGPGVTGAFFLHRLGASEVDTKEERKVHLHKRKVGRPIQNLLLK